MVGGKQSNYVYMVSMEIGDGEGLGLSKRKQVVWSAVGGGLGCCEVGEDASKNGTSSCCCILRKSG